MKITNNTKKLIPLSRDSIQLVKGLIIGKVLTILLLGGLWLLIRPYLQSSRSTTYPGGGTISEATSSFKTVNNVPIGSFKYSGSTAWAPISQVANSQIQSDRPELKLKYVNPQTGNPSSSVGIQMLLDGEIDFALLSRPLTKSEYNAAQQQGFILEQRQVATDGVAVAVNNNLEVSGLTVEQLQQIYLGEITNWSQLGGADLAIVPFSQNQEDAVSTLFSGNKLDGKTLSSDVQYVNSPTEALRQVSQTPGGVYFGSARAIVPQCTVKTLDLGTTLDKLVSPYSGTLVQPDQCPQKRNRVNTVAIQKGIYPLRSKLFVVTKRNNGKEELIGDAYTKLLLTDEGLNAIKDAGFVPMR